MFEKHFEISASEFYVISQFSKFMYSTVALFISAFASRRNPWSHILLLDRSMYYKKQLALNSIYKFSKHFHPN